MNYATKANLWTDTKIVLLTLLKLPTNRDAVAGVLGDTTSRGPAPTHEEEAF